MTRWLWLLFPALISAQNSPVREHDITIDDYFSQAYISECAVSPDGQYIAYSEGRWIAGDDRRNYDLWVCEVATKTAKRLTFERTDEFAPFWAPDSQTIYFAAETKREGEKKPPLDGEIQVWRIKRDGTGLTPVTQIEKGIAQFELGAEGNAIFYTIHKEHTIDAWNELRTEFKEDIEYGHGIHRVTELWKLDLETWRREKLVDETRYIRSFAVSPKANRIAMVTAYDQHLITNEGNSFVDVIDVDSGQIDRVPDEWRKTADAPYPWLEDLCWNTSGEILAYTSGYDGYPHQIHTVSWKSGDPTEKTLTRPKDVEVNGALQWTSDTKLAFLAELRALEKIYTIDFETEKSEILTPNAQVVEGFHITPKGEIVSIQSTLTSATDIFFSGERVHEANPQIASWKLPKISLETWSGANGDEVQGILELPPDHEPGKPLPLIVAIHGGPTASTKYCYRYWIYNRTLMPANGYAVLLPNYRGSTGYGDQFMTDLIGRENDIEVEDILKGVDAMIERGIADPEKLGVSGWSNGGYLTNCLIATNRFKAASSGAGVFDMTIQWGEEDTPGHVINYMEGLPWEKPAEYQRASPLYAFKPGITTATLIHVGENDARVPATHSRSLHRALHYYIDAPCELLIHKNEGHGLRSYRHRLAKLKWDLAWFDRYLKGEGE